MNTSADDTITIATRSTRGVEPLWRMLLRRPTFVVTSFILLVLCTSVALAPVIAPYSPTAQDLTNVLDGPTIEHLLGTDDLGRDVLSRLLYGGQVTLLGVIQALVVFLIVGITFGLIAGMSRGVIDTIVLRGAEILLAVPSFIILLVTLSISPGNMTLAMVTIGILTSPLLIRVVRGTTRTVRSELYIRGARTMGLTERQITVHHVLPRLACLIIVQATIFCGMVIIAETGLGYLGFGVRLPQPSWGNMVQTASENIGRSPWLLIPTGGVIIVTIMCMMLLGDSIRDTVAERWAGAPTRRVRSRGNATGAATADSLSPTSVDEAPPLLELRGLTVVVDSPQGPQTLVDNVSFDLNRGETLCIVGESGSGKSVTSLALLGMGRGTRIASGSIRIDGTPVDTGNAEQMRQLRLHTFGYITQDPQPSLDPMMRVGDLLTQFVQLHQGVSRKVAQRRMLELLDRVQIPNPEAVSRRYPHQLSGGMAQRVVIAAALSANPQVLIADEPTTALDVTVQAEILSLLHELCDNDSSMSMLLVTHDWGVVADIADRVAVMRNGRLVEEASCDEIFTDPQDPHTKRMLAADPALAEVHPVRTATQTVLTVRDLTITYPAPGRRGEPFTAVDGVDLTVHSGRTLGLIGESGSGKSSVGNAIVGLVEATSGSIRLFDKTGGDEELVGVSATRRRELSNRVQIIFQDPYGSLNPVRTIGSTLAEPLVLAHGMSRAEARKIVGDALERVELPRETANRYPSQFSGGQRQRVAIARALVLDPEVIVCDEPVSALDLSIQEQVLSLLTSLQDELGVAYLFISHDLSVVRSFCDDIAVMYRGRIVEEGAAQDVILNPQHPYTKSLLEAAPIPDPSVQRGRSMLAQRYVA